MALSRNDLVVVPGWGVGRVDAVEAVDVGEVTVKTYRIELGDDLGRYWVPTDRVDEAGLRPLMDGSCVDEAWELIVGHELPAKQAHWRKRQQRYHDMLMSNEPLELARLIGELVAVEARKREKRQVLSFQERRVLERAKALVIAEIAAATDREPDEVRAAMAERIAAAA